MTEEKTILLETFQPFAQYRNPFTFYYAQTYPLPPKSTIVGMLQNALNDWYGHKYGIGTWWELKVSVHGGFESVFWNYQSLIKGDISLVRYREKIKLWNQGFPLYGGGITSQRSPIFQQELFNGHLYIFLRGQNDLIEEIEQFLLNPNKILYLGRSEDVIFVRRVYSSNELIYNKKPVKKNIWLQYPTYIKLNDKKNNRRFPIKNEKFPVYSIPAKVVFKNNGKTISNKAEITKSTEREPEFEPVIYTGLDYVIFLREGMDVENYRIRDNNLILKIPEEFGWL